MKLYELTIEQKEILKGEFMHGTQKFHCVLDAGDTLLDEEGFHILDESGNPTGNNRKWFISEVQINNCQHNELYHSWIHDLPKIEHNPVNIRI